MSVHDIHTLKLFYEGVGILVGGVALGHSPAWVPPAKRKVVSGAKWLWYNFRPGFVSVQPDED